MSTDTHVDALQNSSANRMSRPAAQQLHSRSMQQGPLTCNQTRLCRMSRARSAHTDNLQVGESIPFFGPAEEAITAPGGDICALWIPVEGVVGFVQLPELLQLPADPAPSQYSTEAKVLKAFKGKRPSTIPGLKGLAHSPHLVEADFGVKLTQIPALRIGAKHRSDPQEVLEGLQELWNDCDSYMPFVREKAIRTVIPPFQQVRPAKKRKAQRSEMLDLHRDMLLNKLLALNISSKRARQIVDTDSSGWRLEMLVGANKMLDLTFQVFRPNSAVPVITAPFEEVYSRVALLWKQEFDSPKPKSVPRSSHHTRQQERNAAAMEERMQSEGLSPIQLHQVQSVVAAVVTKQQQQTQSDMQGMRNIQTTMAAAIENQNKLFEQQMSFFQQFVPALHYSTAASAQLAYPSHAMANMPAAQQQDARQPSQNLPSDAAPFAAQSAV